MIVFRRELLKYRVMISSIRGFLGRHKRKLITGGVIVGGVIILSKYARSKIEEWQERKTKEFLDRTRKSQHFDSTERTCNQTILSLFKSMTDAILRQLSTDELVARLKSNPENRVEIWNEIKIVAFSRVTAFVYGAVLLVAVLRVQLNLIGGYIFKDTNQINSEFQEKYLSLCQRFLNEGLTEMINNLQQKVANIVAKFDLKKKMSLQDVELIFWSIQSELSSDLNDPLLRISDFLIDQNQIEESELYRQILNETYDLLESDELRNVCSSNVSRSFSHLIDHISEYYTSPCEAAAGQLSNPNKVQIPMAKLIPIVNGLISSPHTGDGKNFLFNLIHQLVLNDQFKIMGANIYEAFCDECSS